MDVCVVFVVRTVAWNVKWHEGRKGFKQDKNGSKEKNPGQAKKKKDPTGSMDVCVVFVVRTLAWNVKWHEGRKDLNSTKMDQRGEKTPGQAKKNPTGGMDVCVVFVVRRVARNVKWHEGRKDLNSTKMDQRGKTPDRQKKKNPTGGMVVCVVSVVCCQVEVSATSWSFVQRSPKVWLWSLEKWGGLGPQGAVEPLKKNQIRL
jgi:hypothetical protein